MARRKVSILELRARQIIYHAGLPDPIMEHRFHATRMWRFDLAWPDLKIAAELEGGIWIKGAHTRGGHYNSDCEKYNAATLLGWKILRYTTNTLPMMAEELKQLLKG